MNKKKKQITTNLYYNLKKLFMEDILEKRELYSKKIWMHFMWKKNMLMFFGHTIIILLNKLIY